MDWTLADIRGLVRSLTGKPSVQQVSDEILNSKINHFYQNEFPTLSGMADLVFWCAMNTVERIGNYPIGINMIALQEPLWLNNGDGYKRIWYTLDRLLFFAKYPPDTDAQTGVPAAGLFDSGILYLRPVPDGVYAVKIPALGRPLGLSDDSDKPVDPTWGYTIAVGTAVNIKVGDGDLEGAESLAALLRSKLNIVTAKDRFAQTERRAYPSY
jgi:hypothetical protein